jgi:hypothetical protein
MENLCSCKSNNESDKQKRCYFKLLMELMDHNYYLRIGGYVQSDQIDLRHLELLICTCELFYLLSMKSNNKGFSRSSIIHCCNAHDKFGFQCNKPVLKTELF